MDDNCRDVVIAAITTFGTVATAYIAARWHITRKNKGEGKDED